MNETNDASNLFQQEVILQFNRVPEHPDTVLILSELHFSLLNFIQLILLRKEKSFIVLCFYMLGIFLGCSCSPQVAITGKHFVLLSWKLHAAFNCKLVITMKIIKSHLN